MKKEGLRMALKKVRRRRLCHPSSVSIVGFFLYFIFFNIISLFVI